MKNLMKVALLLVAFVTLSFISAGKKEINVVIDAGHGGHDLGATHDDVLEKSIVAEVTKKIQSMNTDADIKIHITRTDDNYLTLQERTDFINKIKPDLVISLHTNSNKNTTTKGIETFYSEKSTMALQSQELATKLSEEFSKNIPLNNRGVKKAPFWILTKSEVPAVIVEMGFISNRRDKDYLTNEDGQARIAKTILDFITGLKH
jgi:N-acetylmuramoyl-L-alanine amidase